MANGFGFGPYDSEDDSEKEKQDGGDNPSNPVNFDLNQISITEDRAKVVDFSTPYYTAPQAVIVKADGPLAGVTDFAGLKEAEIGVQVGTTSLDAVKNSIAPGVEPKVSVRTSRMSTWRTSPGSQPSTTRSTSSSSGSKSSGSTSSGSSTRSAASKSGTGGSAKSGAAKSSAGSSSSKSGSSSKSTGSGSGSSSSS